MRFAKLHSPERHELFRKVLVSPTTIWPTASTASSQGFSSSIISGSACAGSSDFTDQYYVGAILYYVKFKLFDSSKLLCNVADLSVLLIKFIGSFKNFCFVSYSIALVVEN